MFAQKLENLAKGLLRPMNPNGASLLGLLTLLWGVWILNPCWAVFTRAQVYSKSLEFADEWAWGTWATICGLSILVSVYRSNALWLARSAGFAVWHWLTVSTMMWLGDWQDIAGITYMFIGFYALFVFLNIRVNFVKQGIRTF